MSPPAPPPAAPVDRHRRRFWSLLLALALGAVLFWFGWVVLGADSQGDPGDVITTGTVTTVAGDDGGCRATARFDVKAREYTAANTAPGPDCPYRVGEQVQVAYDPADPDGAVLLDAGPISAWRWLALLAGCVLLLYAVVGLVRAAVLRWRDRGRDQGPG